MKASQRTRPRRFTFRDQLERSAAAWRRLVFSARFWVLCVILIIVIFIAYFVLANRYTPLTTNGYVQAFVIQVTSQVEGQVVRVNVRDNQPIKCGDLLFEVDPRPFAYRVAVLEARLEQANKQVAEMKNQLLAFKADMARTAAEEDYARVVREQETAIRKQLATTERRYLKAVSKHQVAQADQRRSQAMTRKTREAIATQKALVEATRAELLDARLKLKWTRTCAPANGYAYNVQLRVGSYVHTGVPVITCIDTDQWWVVANYPENCLENMRPGQLVRLSFNNYPGRIFEGVVQTIGLGVHRGQSSPSGNLPAVNQRSNWINPAQRFQVWVTPNLPPEYPLRVGATSTTAVYVSKNYWLNGVTRFVHKIIALLDYLR